MKIIFWGDYIFTKNYSITEKSIIKHFSPIVYSQNIKQGFQKAILVIYGREDFKIRGDEIILDILELKKKKVLG